ncbi:MULTISPECIES: hypothetical protein [Streptomyces]|uniref:hypothetical protein n=1 Tax=Streptomyces TaxID=1883 RepID=UPI00293043A6|nr:hypothetical protein [Streptomyces sp. NEAU-HV9]
MLRDDVRALAAGNTPYRQQAIDTLASGGADTTALEQTTNITPAGGSADAEGCSDDPLF